MNKTAQTTASGKGAPATASGKRTRAEALGRRGQGAALAKQAQKEALDKRDARGAKSRAAILRAAAQIFAEQGLAGARTDAIAAAAGVNKALLYYYFKSKNGLYLAVLEEHLKKLYQQLAHALNEKQNARATLLAYVAAHFDFLSQRPDYLRLSLRFMIAGAPGLGRLARKYFMPLRAQLIQRIEQGVRSGELRKVDAAQTAVSLVALVVFYFASPAIRFAGGGDPYEKRNLAKRRREILSLVRYGLFKHPEESCE